MPNYITPSGIINTRGEGTRIDPNYQHPAFPLRSAAVLIPDIVRLIPAEPMSIGELILRYFPNARAEQVREALNIKHQQI